MKFPALVTLLISSPANAFFTTPAQFASHRSRSAGLCLNAASATVGEGAVAKKQQPKLKKLNGIVKKKSRKKATVSTASSSQQEQRQSDNKKTKKNAVRLPLEELNLGEEVRGKVVAIQPYGVFFRCDYEVNNGCFLHRSKMMPTPAQDTDLNDQFSIGQPISARVTSIDFEKRQVKVSQKQKRKSIKSLKVGQKLEGVIKSVHNYGFFVNIGYKKDGLVHMSKIIGKVKNLENMIGEKLEVYVLQVSDSGLALSLHPPEELQSIRKDKRWTEIATSAIETVGNTGAEDNNL